MKKSNWYFIGAFLCAVYLMFVGSYVFNLFNPYVGIGMAFAAMATGVYCIYKGVKEY